MSTKRYRVRKTRTEKYTDKGPDLLRPARLVMGTLGKAMGSSRTGWYTRRDPAGPTKWTTWQGPMPRREALEWADSFVSNALSGAKAQLGRVREGKVSALAEILVVNVPHVNLPGVHDGAELVADLARVQFKPNIGGFVCKEYNGVPGSGWSDHAWGDAVDLVRGPGPKNDELTDWCARMAREGCFGPVEQFIGSKGGRVYSYTAPTYAANLGGPSSHLMHVHCSYVQHFGANPHCR